MMPPKTQEEKEEEQRKGVPGILSSILGFAAPIAGAIPTLLKGPQEDFLRRQQEGGGAGAAMARQTASEAARRVIGASTAQPSSGRGGALREGLRAADEIVQRGAQQAAITGARESQAATQMLRQNQLLRRSAARTFGAGIGQGLSGIAATLASAKDQGPVQPGAGEGVQAGEPLLEEDPTGLGGQAGLPGPLGLSQADFKDQLIRIQTAREPVGPQATPEQLFPQQQAQQSVVGDQLAQPTAQGQQQAAPQEVGGVAAVKDTGFAEAIGMQDPMAKFQITMENLAETTAGKRDAADAYRATAGGTTEPSVPPSAYTVGNMSDPNHVGEFIYTQVMNSDLDPWEAVKLLELYGVPVDYERLGIMDIGAGLGPEAQSGGGNVQR